MKSRSLWSRLMLPFVAVMAAIVVLIVGSAQQLLTTQDRQDSWKQLERTARLVMRFLSRDAPIDSAHVSNLDARCVELGELAQCRLTVIAPDGMVLADSQRASQEMDNHANRPEVRVALDGGIGRSERFSDMLGQWMRYVAAPVRVDGKVTAVVRTAEAAPRGIGSTPALLKLLVLGLVAVAGGSLALALLVRRRVVLPLVGLRRMVRRVGQGTDGPIEPPAADSREDFREVEALARATRQLADRHRQRLGVVVESNRQQQSVLTSMSEGLLAVDLDERVLSLNDAAARILKVIAADPMGRSIQEVFRHTQFQRFVAALLAADAPMEDDLVVIDRGEERFLQARGSALRDAEDRKIGVVIVINDVTRLRRLENMRRDFAANVSHELRTPVTSIKGFIETLRDGAADDPETAREFLEIIHRQADRLEAIINDLLQLARIEQIDERDQLETELGPIAPVLESAIAGYQAQADEKNITIRTDLSPDLCAKMNAPLIEQAVANLIDNAIKHSPAGGVIDVQADEVDGLLCVRVRDGGCGIAPEHHKRLFQRFYRVDRARSRAAGGTGLGLAIVKHIVLAHGGSVEIESAVNRGSMFTICIPATRQ